jgi:nucleotide-binding universal stress UspA family protein
LHLFHCIDPRWYSLADPDIVWKTRDDLQHELEQLVSELRSQGRTKNFEVNIVVEVGNFAVVSPQIAQSLNPDLIIVGTHGRTGWRKTLLGSVAEAVIDHATCPVLAVGSSAVRMRTQAPGPESILLVSDPATRSQLAESFAFSLTCKYSSRLSIVDVIENRSGRIRANVSQLKVCDTDASETISDQQPIESQTEIGSKSDLILQVADQNAADLIVLPVPESHRFADRFLSTDSYRVVCGAPCPVLTVRAR